MIDDGWVTDQLDPTTHEGLAALAHRESRTPPAIPTAQERSLWSASTRAQWWDDREAFRMDPPWVPVPGVRRISSALMTQLRANRQVVAKARPGLFILGEAGTGKTTAQLMMASQVDRVLRMRAGNKPGQRHPKTGELYIPVAYISLPQPVTIKMLDRRLCDFYEAWVAERASTETLTRTAKDYVRRCGTVLIFVDDIHFLTMSNINHQLVNDHLKVLANDLGVTFVYGGINHKSTRAILSEGGASTKSQTGRRFAVHTLEAFPLDNSRDHKVWDKLLTVLATQMPLLDGSEGDLLRFSDYIHSRTGGYFEPLNALLTKAFETAVETGVEKFTGSIFDQVDLDFLSSLTHGDEIGRTRARATNPRKPEARTSLVNRPTVAQPAPTRQRASRAHRPRVRPDVVSGGS